MKKLFICSGLGMMFFMLAGCTTNYVMTTKNGQTIVTQGVTGAVRWISATRRRTPNQPATSRIAISGNEAIV